jgi:hypothetical protein
MINWKGFAREWSWLILRYCLGIFLDRLRKTMKILGIADLWAEI